MWPTRSKVVRFEPGEEVAFRVKDNFTIWSFRLADDGAGGTLLTQRREAPDGISDRSYKLGDRFMGGVAKFEIELAHGMRQTLAKIRALLCGGSQGFKGG